MPPVKSEVTTTSLQLSAMTSFRLYLQSELARRCVNNRQYSLRSFAMNLGIDHSTLSQLLRGKRPMTAKTIEKLGGRLGLDQSAIEKYAAYEEMFARTAARPVRGVRQLTCDLMYLVSDVYHYNILELVRLKEFKPDTLWIARMLGITQDEVNIALSRLLRLGLLEMTDRDCWTDKTGDPPASLEDFAYIAIRRFSEKMSRLSPASARE